MSRTPCFAVFFQSRPLNLRGESSPPKFRGYGLTGELNSGFASDTKGAQRETPNIKFFGWDPAGLVWHGQLPKKARNGEKIWKTERERAPQPDRGRNGQKKWPPKMEKKWKKNSLKNPFFCHSLPLSSWGGLFSIWVFPFFPHFRLLAVFHAIPPDNPYPLN